MSATTPELGAVVRRLERVERQHRRLRVIGTLAALAAAAVVLVGLGEAGPKTITAAKFVGVDPDGKPCVELGFFEDAAGPALLLKNKEGQRLVILAASSREGAALQLRDKDKERLNLRAYPDGFAGLDIKDPNEKQRVWLGLPGAGGDPGLKFSDKNIRRLELGHLGGDVFGLQVEDKSENTVVQLPPIPAPPR